MAGAKISSQSAENCAIVLFPNIKNIKQWEYNDLLYLFTNNLYRCTLVNTWDLTAISLQSLEVIICASQQVFVSWRLILRCTGRSCISDRHTDTVWNDLPATGFKSLHAEFHEKQFGFMENTHDSQGDCVFRPVQEVSAAAFRPFLVSVWFYVNQFEREEPAWFHRHASVSLNRPEPAGECGQCRLCLTAGRQTGDLNQRAEADRCVASLQTGRCSAARRHDPNSNREEELNVSSYFNATWFTSF